MQAEKHAPSVGLSPRGRGNPSITVVVDGERRSIPAWAGQPAAQKNMEMKEGVYPRVGGATSFSFRDDASLTGLSPRGRGNPQQHAHLRPTSRSIPAWAGQPPLSRPALPLLRVYPRVGGATTWTIPAMMTS